MNNSTQSTSAAPAAVPTVITIGDKTGTLFVNGEPTGTEVNIHNQEGLTKAELLRRLNLELTEAEVIAWLRAQSNRFAHEFPLGKDFEVKANSCGTFFAACWTGSRYEVGIGQTVEAAISDLHKSIPAPIELAAKKRKEAAQLLAEADQLSAKAA